MEETPFWVSALIFVCFVLLPIGALLLGIRTIFTTYRFRKNAVWIVGKVVDMKVTESTEDQITTTFYQPTFEFAGPDGAMLRGTTATASAKFDFERDSEHAIMVNLNEPGVVHMPGNSLYIVGAAMIIIGGTIAYFGASVLWTSG